jgi:urease accessory protein
MPALLALSLIVGGAVALAFALPPFAMGLLAAAIGATIALDSPPDAITVREAILMQLGMFFGATVFFWGVIEAASLLRRPWQQIGIRVLGSWIAASALLGLALRFAR